MRKLSSFLENPFDDDGISIDELISFSTDSLQRMIANNTGDFLAARIIVTTTALNAVGDFATADQTKLGLRKARKMAKDTFRRTLPARVVKISGAVVAKYGEKSPEWTECFPQGRDIFNSCADDKVEIHLQTLKNGVTAHVSDLGAPVAADADGLLTSWTAVYNASESSSGAKTTAQEGKKGARQSLQLELFLNLLAIAASFPRQPEKLALYMQQSLLEDHPQHPAAPAPATPPPAP